MGQVDFSSWEELEHFIEEAHKTALLFPEVGRSHFTAASKLTLFEAEKVNNAISDRYNKIETIYSQIEGNGFKYDVMVYVLLTPEELDEAARAKEQAEKDGMAVGYGYFPETTQSCQIYQTPMEGMKHLRRDTSVLDEAANKLFHDMGRGLNKLLENVNNGFSAQPDHRDITEEEIDQLWEEHSQEWAENEEKKEGDWFNV